MFQSIMWEKSRQELETAGHITPIVKSREKINAHTLTTGSPSESYSPGPREWVGSSSRNSTTKEKTILTGRLTGQCNLDNPSLRLLCLEILRLVKLTIKANHHTVPNCLWSLCCHTSTSIVFCILSFLLALLHYEALLKIIERPFFENLSENNYFAYTLDQEFGKNVLTFNIPWFNISWCTFILENSECISALLPLSRFQHCS